MSHNSTIHQLNDIVDFRLRHVIRDFNKFAAILLGIACILDVLISIFVLERVPGMGSGRLFLVSLIMFFAWKGSIRIPYRITSFITLAGLYLAFVLFPLFGYKNYPAENLVLPMFLIMVMAILPLMIYHIKKDIVIIISWQIVLIGTFLFVEIYILSKLTEMGYNGLFLVFRDNPMILFGHLGALVFLVLLIYNYRVINFEQIVEIVDLNKRLVNQLELVNKQKQILDDYREELLQIQEELKKINGQLEEKVELRSEQLEEQNEQLIRYGFMNSHLLRAPITRLKGLIRLNPMIDSSEDKIKLLKYIRTSIRELDLISKSINDVLETKKKNKVKEIEKKVEEIYEMRIPGHPRV